MPIMLNVWRFVPLPRSTHVFGIGLLRPNRVLRQKRITYSPFRPLPTWNALQKVEVGHRQTDTGDPTLDGTLDLVGYQLYRDGLLPQTNILGRTLPAPDTSSISAATLRKLERERDVAVTHIKRHGVRLRRSIKETAVTIGCDEAGRGPLAGPVVGAAVSRLPVSSFNNEFDQLYEAPEQFQIFDSKSVSERQRDLVFAMITGHVDFFDIASCRKFAVHHCAGDEATSLTLSSKRFDSHVKLSKLPFKKLLSMQTPYLITYHGYNSAGNYVYFWSIGIANHTYIDEYNIYNASMNTMHRSAQSIWHMLNDARFSHEAAPRPRSSSIAQYLFSRFCTAANHDNEKHYQVPHHLELLKGATEYFDFEPIQPPLVLIDGHAVPGPSYDYFTSVRIGGDVQPIIEGDKRSLSIAAASCLAKVTRDELMNYIDALYPGYGFRENKGYPVEQHMKYVAKKGLCPIHRKTYRPCRAVLEKRLQKK
ncbi:ribonuclease HII, putative [Leishmania tarentolae]|uniref:Ribonuclease n=1 Tax=Leishmania tarentolae TaxID=5689 RepID=A0A640KVR8_LEITA|nr:ribonuclease HII, putative [Leishmania tarentolae]